MWNRMEERGGIALTNKGEAAEGVDRPINCHQEKTSSSETSPLQRVFMLGGPGPSYKGKIPTGGIGTGEGIQTRRDRLVGRRQKLHGSN